MTEPQKINHVGDPKKAAFANDFMRRLAGDVLFGRESETLEDVFKKYGVKKKDASGKEVIDWEKTADALIESLDELLFDEAEKKADGSLQITNSHNLHPDVKEVLKNLFPKGGDVSSKDMASKLSQKNLQLDKTDASKKESLLAFLYRTTPEGTTFATENVQAILNALKQFLNSFEPGLGDTVARLLGNMNTRKPDTEQTCVEDSFERLYNTMYLGEEAFAEYQGVSPDAGCEYRNLAFPGSPEQWEQFFNGSWRQDSYTLEDGASHKDFEWNFKSMFLDRLTKPESEGGLARFSFEAYVDEDGVGHTAEEAEQGFIQYMKAAFLGGKLDENFIGKLDYREELQDGLQTPRGVFQYSGSGREALLSYIETIDMAAFDRYKAAALIIDWVNDNKDLGIEFQRDYMGTLDIPDTKVVEGIKDKYNPDLMNYYYVKNQLADVLVNYAKVKTAQEFSERAMRGMSLPGVKENFEMDAPHKVKDLIIPSTSSMHIAPAPAEHASAGVSTYHAVPTGNGTPSIIAGDQGDRVAINNRPVSGQDGQFSVYAEGQNAVAAAPNMDLNERLDVNSPAANNDTFGLTA